MKASIGITTRCLYPSGDGRNQTHTACRLVLLERTLSTLSARCREYLFASADRQPLPVIRVAYLTSYQGIDRI